MSFSTRFTHAITRRPPASITRGLRAVDTGSPDLGPIADYRVVEVPEAERAAAITIRFSDLLLMPAGFPRTRDTLATAGFSVREIGSSECAKLDGGMSCLSLRFTPS